MTAAGWWRSLRRVNAPRAAGLAAALLLLAPGAARAEVLTLGSSLSAPATIDETHPVDSSYFHTTGR